MSEISLLHEVSEPDFVFFSSISLLHLSRRCAFLSCFYFFILFVFFVSCFLSHLLLLYHIFFKYFYCLANIIFHFLYSKSNCRCLSNEFCDNIMLNCSPFLKLQLRIIQFLLPVLQFQ